MKYFTEAQLRALLERAYEAGWRDRSADAEVNPRVDDEQRDIAVDELMMEL